MLVYVKNDHFKKSKALKNREIEGTQGLEEGKDIEEKWVLMEKMEKKDKRVKEVK